MAQREDRFSTRRARRDAELAQQEEAWVGRQAAPERAAAPTGLATDQPREYAEPRSARSSLRRDRSALRAGPAVDEDQGDPRLLTPADPPRGSAEAHAAPSVEREPLSSAPAATTKAAAPPQSAPPMPAPRPESSPTGSAAEEVADADESLPMFATRGERRAFLHARALDRGEVPEDASADVAPAESAATVHAEPGPTNVAPQHGAPQSATPPPAPMPDALVRMRERWADEDRQPAAATEPTRLSAAPAVQEAPAPSAPDAASPVEQPKGRTADRAAPAVPEPTGVESLASTPPEPARAEFPAATPATALPSRRTLRPVAGAEPADEPLLITSPGAQLDDPATVSLDGLAFGSDLPGDPSPTPALLDDSPRGASRDAPPASPEHSWPATLIGGIAAVTEADPSVAPEPAPEGHRPRRERRRAADPEFETEAPKRRGRKAPVVQAPMSTGITVVSEGAGPPSPVTDADEDDAHLGELVHAPSAPVSARRRSERDAAESIGRAPSRAPLYTLGGFLLIAIGFGVAALIVL